ncbi:hypothetical protein PMAYCL1PPCAC_19474 [Pristionchus mayeri]|uniref:Secreted protein n=1 Tax=Pristionchus mayeri TaxID=1317129 RepID=A0AAN5CRI0_9BILA|nr:hypothetical protein PMAYCL1PPCAC_19474 [Pristionchus mayeri]
MQRVIVLAIMVGAADCIPLRSSRDAVTFKQIEDIPPFDNADSHVWNHPWHKSFNAEHSSHGDVAIFGRFRSESDLTQGGNGELTPVVPSVSHTNQQLAPTDQNTLGRPSGAAF